jgi:phage tail-like protein
MGLNLDGVKEKVADANKQVQDASDAASKDLKKAREEGEQELAQTKKDLDKDIEDSKLPGPIKKAAKSANSAGYKGAVKAIDKAKKTAKGAVDKGAEKSHEAVAKAAGKAKNAVADAEKQLKGVVKDAKGWLDGVIADSNLPGPVKDLAKKGVAALEKLANKELANLKKSADGMIDDLQKNADGLIDHLKDNAYDILGFKVDKPKAAVTPPKPVPPQRIHDHWGGFRFKIEIEQIAAGAFTAVDGLSAEVEMIEYQGGQDLYPRQIPGRPKVAPIVLKKGYINTAVLWDWMKKTMDGDVEHKSASVILFADDNNTEVVRYNLFEVWPSRWQGFQMDAQSSNAMIEELELQVRHITRVAS